MSKKLNTFKLFSVLAVLAMIFSSIQPPAAQAQGGDGLKRQFNAESGRITFIIPAIGKSLPATRALQTSARPQDPAMALASRYAPEFGLKNAGRNLTAMESKQSEDGRITVHFQQNHENVPVMGGELIVNTNKYGDLYSISGEVSPDLTLSTQASISTAQAQETALQAVAKWYGKEQSELQTTEPELWIYDESLLRPSTRPVELTWRMEVTVRGNSLPVRELVLVNAQTGGISLHFNQVDGAGKPSVNSSVSHQDSTPTSTPEVTGTPVASTPEPVGRLITPEPQTALPVLQVPENLQSAELAAIWYVAPGGNDANACTSPLAPCASVNAVLAKPAFVAGDTIKLAAGTYGTPGYGYLINITKAVNLSGGWDAGYTSQTGFSTFDGQGTRSGIITQDMLAMGAVSVDRFIIKNGQTGIYNNNTSQFTLTNSSIHSNTGGGIEHFGLSMILNNVVISNNTNTSLEGGGIRMGNTSLVMNNVTITGNQAYDGGGIFHSPYYGSGTVSIQMSNTILAGNISNISASPNCKGPITSMGHNMISDTTGCTVTAGTGDKLNVNPLLGVFLPEYGYQTLRAGSPAINAGSDCYGTTDQRGVTRIDACDIGAYEYRAPSAVTSLSMISGSGQTTGPNLDFKQVLKVAALDAMTNPVPGVQVTFTAPGSGASLSFKSSGAATAPYQTDAAGVATTSVMTANNQLGTYSVSANAAGAANPVNFALENLAWFVAPTGADTNSCKSPGSPCATINGALAKIASGDQILVAEGVYTGSDYYVVSVNKNALITGGWNPTFTARTGMSIIDGQKTRKGLGINSGMVLKIENFILQNGTGTADGGAIHNAGQLTIRNSSVSNNTAEEGGAIDNYGSLFLDNTTISGNRASRYGGGIINRGTVSLNNTTISNNASKITGGGIYNYVGSGITMQNSIIAGNVITGVDPSYTGPDCGGIVGSLGNNLIGSTAGCTITAATGDKFNVSPKLAAYIPSLGFMPLQTTSPAINAGNAATCLPADQRGSPRVGVCDMGAYEYRTAGAAVTIVPVIADLRLAPNTPANPAIQAMALDQWQTPVSGVAVTFTAPSTGPGGLFSNGTSTISATTNADGIAAVNYTSNNQTGPYDIDAYAAALNKHAAVHVTNYALYVAVSGNDANTCTTSASPCATINKALEKAVDGDVILVAGGTYTKKIVDYYSHVILISKNVTLRGGWDAAFSTQNSESVIDGENIYEAVVNSASDALMERFTIKNGGGGVDNVGGLTLDQMFVTSNDGFGVSNYTGTLTLRNSTISQNRGSGLSNGDQGTTYVYNSTIANNTTLELNYYGGGIRTINGNVIITNSIVAGNSASQSPDCYAYGGGGAVVSNGYNIIGTTSGCFVNTATGDKFNVDPKISSLLMTGYHPLQQGSPAINAGNPATCTQRDQRGVLRLSDSKCDIGAYEYKAAGTAVRLVGVNTFVQRTPVNTAFPRILEAAALDADGSPVGGVSISFSAPAGGASGVFAASGLNSTSGVTNANGYLAASKFTANGQYGDYNITASATGLPNTVSFQMHNGAWLVSSTNGSDANNCLALASPCASIKGVLDKHEFNSGETIWVAAGTYSTASNYYIKDSVNIIGGWNTSFAAAGGASILQESYTPQGAGSVVFKQVVFQGGGIDNLANLVLENSTVRQSGYGIRNEYDGNLTLRNVTLSENTITALRNNGTALIINSTITNNQGTTIGGIENSGTVTLQDSIVAGNKATYLVEYAGVDCTGNFISLQNNIIGTIGSYDDQSKNYDCRGNWAYDLVGDDIEPIPADQVVDPVSKQDPVTGQWIHALPLGSLAIDFGYPASCPATDQRGVTRPQGTSCDSGAYEYQFYRNANSLLIRTYDGKNSSVLPGQLVCDQSDPNCLAGDEHARAAHKYAIGTYNFYKNTFGRKSIDNAGGEILSAVHYDTGFDNAFWNGYMMIYGDAYGYPLADDIVAHELTHGVTQHEANLFYYYQSGAINESFSDLWGEYYDQVNGQGNDDASVKWIIGEDIKDYPKPVGFNVPALRDMRDPTRLLDPDRMSSQYYYKGEADNGGVHWNSGINNKAVYLMVDGGTFNQKTVKPLGWEKAGAIYYEVNTNLLTTGADYSDLYYALQQACASLLGTHGIIAEDCTAVKNAIDAVEMNAQPGADFNPDVPLCAISTPVISIADDFENGTGKWTFGQTGVAHGWQLDSQYGPYAQSGRHSLFGDDSPQYNGTPTDATAMLASFVVPTNGYLWFAHAFAFEYNEDGYYDGGVIEYSTNGGATWTDASALIEANPYNGNIYNLYNNPLKGRSAFVGTSHGYISTRLNLSGLAGKTVTIRWRMGLDGYISTLGWWVDNVKVYTCGKSATFADVLPSHPYFQQIEILYANHYTAGCATNPLRFCPDQTMNRGEAAVFIIRGTLGAGFLPSPATHFFKDDWRSNPWAEPWAEAMKNNHISAGCQTLPVLKYCPWDKIPREQAVVFAVRLRHGVDYLPPAATGTMFADMTDVNSLYTSWAEQAYIDGLIPNCGTAASGKPMFCPKALVSRGLAAYMIVKAKNLTMP